jgi:hypothetical protein
MLYQVWSLIRTVDDAVQARAAFRQEQLIQQAEDLMLEVIRVMEDAREAEIVSKLLRFRDALQDQDQYDTLGVQAEAARAEVINVVNNFFYDRLTGLPEIRSYMEEMQKDKGGAGH